MKKTTKLLFSLASTLLLATGCGLTEVSSSNPTTSESSGTTQTAEEKVNEAYGLLVYSGLNSVVNNFDLIQSVAGLEDVKITYSVPEAAANYLKVEGSVMQVTRPTTDEGDQMLKPGFTATFTLGDVTKTKDFNVKVIAALAENEDLTLVTNPVKDTNYKLGFVGQTETLFFSGSKAASYYGSTSNLPYKGVDVQLKETTGGYNLTFTDSKGITQYIFVTVTTNDYGTHTNFDWSTTLPEDGCVWTIDAANNTLTTTFGGERHWIGSSGTYGTFDAFNDTEKEEDNAYLAHLYTYTGEIPDAPTLPEYAKSLSLEKDYRLGMVIADDKLVYFTGTMNSYYGATSENAEEAVVAKVEEATNGYYLSFKSGETKSYIGLVQSGTHYNFKIQENANTVFTWNEEYHTLTTTLEGETFYMGTYGTNSTVGFSKWSYIETSYPLHFYETGTTSTPETPTLPSDPVEPETPATTVTTIADALAASEGTPAVLEGTVTEIYSAWSDQYSNMSFYIQDDAENKILVFRTGTKVGVGDKVKVEGTVTIYNETAQIAQGATTTITAAHECSTFTEATCIDAAKCTVCGKEGEASLGHTEANSEGKCDRCGTPISSTDNIVTASKTVADLITEYGWDNSTTKQEFQLDDVVTVKVDGGSNSGKAYDGEHIRIYATDTPAGTLTITLAEGHELVSIKISTATGTYAFLCVDGTDTDISNVTTSVSGSSVKLNSVKNGSNGKQVRVTAIEVQYK